MAFAPPFDPTPPAYFVLDECGNPMQVSRVFLGNTKRLVLCCEHVAGNMHVITFLAGSRGVLFVTQLRAVGVDDRLVPYPSYPSETCAEAIALHARSRAYAREVDGCPLIPPVGYAAVLGQRLLLLASPQRLYVSAPFLWL